MRYDSNRQSMIDKVMCKPGYTWNETLGKCLRAGGGAEITEGATLTRPEKAPNANGAIAQETAKRAQSAPAPKAVK